MNEAGDFDETDAVQVMTCTAKAEDQGQRFDRVLALRFPDFSRARLKNLILEGAVRLNDAICTDPSRKVASGALLEVAVPPAMDYAPAAENIPLSILYEDDDLLVIDKQAGLVVHPGAGNFTGTLVNALLYHCGDTLSGIGGVRRPGIVHRLDKDTSGLMVAAKSDMAHQGLSAQLADRTLSRHYKALIWGVPSLSKGVVDQPIGRHPANRLKMAVTRKDGREARTHYHVLHRYANAASLIDCKLETGRTHQIRVHMAYIRHPLAGDPLYGLARNAAESMLKKAGYEEADRMAILAFPRQALHAFQIGFIHPRSGKEMSFKTELPADMQNLIGHFESGL